MILSLAQTFADHLVKWLLPNCERLQIAGSIRRHRPECADVDLVCVPRETIYRDMFQVETGRQNHLWMFLNHYVGDQVGRVTPCAPGLEKPRILTGSEYSSGLKQMIVQLPKCQLDLWFASPENFATRLLMRTGSKEHNIWFASRAHDHGFHWFPYYGLVRLDKVRGHAAAPGEVFMPGELAYQKGLIFPTGSETELYGLLQLKYIDPPNREQPWLDKHLDWGL